jgi:hypothetical protein
MQQQVWNRLNLAKFAIKTAFWMPIYMFLGYMTIRNSIELIQSYQENKIDLNMTSMMNQPTVPFPNYTICLYFNVTKIFDAADAKNRIGSNSSYSKDLEKFFSEYSDSLKTRSTDLTWPNTTNGVIVRYFNKQMTTTGQL